MLVRDLVYLAEAADLSSLDISARPLTVTQEGEYTYAIYRGAYIAGQRRIIHSGPNNVYPFVVSAKQFKDLTGLLTPTSEVSLHKTEEGITIVASDIKATLRFVAEEPAEPLPTDEAANILLAQVNRSDLLEELTLASEFVARSTSVPLYSGVRLVISGSRIGLIAFDGFGGLFTSSVDCESGRIADYTLPVYDLIVGLRLADSTKVTLSEFRVEGSRALRIAITGEASACHVLPLQGNWPDLKSVTQPTPRVPITLQADRLRTAVAAGKTLLTNNTLTLATSTSGKTVLKTEDAEAGQFITELAGKLPLGQEIVFDSSCLLLASKFGGEVAMEIAENPGLPTLIRSGKRRYWAARRVR